MTYAAALKTTTHPKTQCRKPYAATQHLRPSVHEQFLATAVKQWPLTRSVLNGSERTDGCFTAVFFQTQHA